jgi:hypothetical protein
MKRFLLAVTLLAGSLSASGALPFIEDDYVKAMAAAKAKNVPLFVETWAPW